LLPFVGVDLLEVVQVTNSPTMCKTKELLLREMSRLRCFAGDEHTVIQSAGNRLRVCGRNHFGQLGLGHEVNRCSFKELELACSLFATGGDHSIALTEDVLLYGFGNNNDGQLGLKDTINRNKPTEIPFFSSHPIRILLFRLAGVIP